MKSANNINPNVELLKTRIDSLGIAFGSRTKLLKVIGVRNKGISSYWFTKKARPKYKHLLAFAYVESETYKKDFRGTALEWFKLVNLDPPPTFEFDLENMTRTGVPGLPKNPATLNMPSEESQLLSIMVTPKDLKLILEILEVFKNHKKEVITLRELATILKTLGSPM